jgi:hypothetical protein
MQYRKLGRTDLTVSELGFGGIPILRLETSEAEKVLKRAFERGITLYDTAPLYKDSQEKMGRALHSVRDHVVLATKTMKRDQHGAQEQLENSLRALQTDVIDVFQLHQVSREDEWLEITGPGGAMDALSRAMDKGRIRSLGVTSHSLDMAVMMTRSDVFDTVQFPCNLIETDPLYRLFPDARERGMGILAMKPFAGGVINDAGLAFSFLRQWPDVIPIPGFDSREAVDQVADMYERENTVTDDDLSRMGALREELGSRFCRRCEYCLPCPSGVMITMAMGYPLLVSRMSRETAVNFARKAMNTVPDCEDCGECVDKCPYDLPIPEMIREHYQMYLEDLERV